MKLIVTPYSGLVHKIIIALMNCDIFSDILTAFSFVKWDSDNMRRWFFSLELPASNIRIYMTFIWHGSILSPLISVVFGSNSDLFSCYIDKIVSFASSFQDVSYGMVGYQGKLTNSIL